MVLVKGPRDLARIERGSDLVLNLATEGLSKEVVLASLRIECTKEPKFVFGNRTTNVKTGVNFGKTVGRRTRVSRSSSVSRTKLFGLKKYKCITADFVRSALRDHVENTAGGLSILGAVGTCFDLDFLHELKRQVRT